MSFALGSEWTQADSSNLIGTISLAFWLCNGIPLVYEIYKRKSADGVSLGFVGLWAIGDVFNLVGSIWAHLVPTTIFVAVWYIFSDVIIIGEAFYFAAVYPKKDEGAPNEETALIESPAELFIESESSSTVTREIVFNTCACVAVCAMGAAGWYVSARLLANGLKDVPEHERPKFSIGPQVLGYASALLYLCARIPQIIKNYRKQKTDGLALLFFIFSVWGNVTYAASIIVFSSEKEYLVTNIPWLAGSLGTLAFDFIILFQFLLYRHRAGEQVEAREETLLNT